MRLETAIRVPSGHYHGRCTRCGQALIIPNGGIWGFRDTHPWDSMCLYRMQETMQRYRRMKRKGGWAA